jgi:hypothetical protein
MDVQHFFAENLLFKKTRFNSNKFNLNFFSTIEEQVYKVHLLLCVFVVIVTQQFGTKMFFHKLGV